MEGSSHLIALMTLLNKDCHTSLGSLCWCFSVHLVGFPVILVCAIHYGKREQIILFSLKVFVVCCHVPNQSSFKLNNHKSFSLSQ